jgi:para-aminobenzoate synthetase component 1
MRRTIALPMGTVFRAHALRDEDVFLFRRVADRGLALLAVGRREVGEEPRFDAQGVADDWWFGHLAYGFKDRLERLSSRHADPFGWPLAHWFVPRFVIEWRGAEAFLHAHAADESAGRAFAAAMASAPAADAAPFSFEWRASTERAAYLAHAAALLRAIQRGDIYEVNYCIALSARAEGFDPFVAFEHLLRATDSPYAGFYRMGDRFALCASPERFLAFEGRRVVAEPMKGTRPRGASTAADEALKAELAADAKERSENVMAVDVMRNDLARVAALRSVRVEALCAVRSYPRVHQLVSTVAAERAEGRSPWDVVRAAFPMASMTGAPKIRAMELIDAAEDQARGLYSGTLGFFAPDGTGDLNVVIRTLLHDARSGRLSLHAGSALTAQCAPDAEWSECLVKFNSITHALAAPR